MRDYFSGDYTTARDRFRRGVSDRGGTSYALALAATGPDHGHLTIDIGWFGSETPRTMLLHVCGIHGVEAFAGSAVQLRLLEGLPRLPEDAAVVFVHVLNPYGMAWLRRANENNVDLNRNFLPEGADYRGRPNGYDALHEFLNPSKLPVPDLFALRAGWLVLKHGRPTLATAIAAGQYDYPEGLFFGGRRLEEGPSRYMNFLTARRGGLRRVFAIDVHTGLGRYGEDTILVDPDHYARLRDRLGDHVEAFSPGAGNVAYRIRGGHHEGVLRSFEGVEVEFVGQEFGTYGPVRVLRALRRENQAHHHDSPRSSHPANVALRRTFCPDDRAWRMRILSRGKDLFDRALSTLDGPGS